MMKALSRPQSMSSVKLPPNKVNKQQQTDDRRNVKHIKLVDQGELEKDYHFGKQIGGGGFGVVLAVREKVNAVTWAMKIVPKVTNPSKLLFVQREIEILKIVCHPHIIYLDKVFETPKKIFMIMELCHGELYTLYKERKPFTENIVRIIVKDLASAVSYLHKMNIVHRDLKMENILLAENPNDPTDEYFIKISDFGLSVIKRGVGISNMLHECCGTAVYMAPEMIANSYSHQCDVWAIGVIVFTLLHGYYPFFSKNDKELINQITNVQPTFSNKLTQGAIKFIKKALTKDPAHRITAMEMLESKWIQGTETGKDSEESDNVIDMMKEWRSEMRLPTGELSDWESFKSKPVMTAATQARETKLDKTKAPPVKTKVNMAVTDIKFERYEEVTH